MSQEAFEVGALARNAGTIKGANRVASILAAARVQIMHRGHESLTLEAVAEQIGISKGNLQYYFPTRSDLLCAVFATEIERHSRDWIAARDAQDDDALSRLKRVVAFELASNRNAEFIALVRERWSLEARNKLARDLTDKWYAWVTRQYSELIAGVYPDLTRKQRLETAAMIYSLVVGATPFFNNNLWQEKCKIDIGCSIENAVDAILRGLR